MAKKKIAMIFDTETANTLERPMIYDLGLVITDRNGNHLETKRWIIKEVFDNRELMDTAYYAEKIPTYYSNVEHLKVSFYVAIAQLRQILKKYSVSLVSAYNMGFDIRAMANTYMELIGKKYNQAMIWATTKKGKFYPDNEAMFRQYVLKDRENKLEFLCLWSLACEVVFTSRNYRKMAEEENWLSEKGNYLTNAEVCYAYLSKDVNFVEEHTALDDAMIETFIYSECMKKNRKNSKSGILFSPWRIPQKY